MERLTNSDKEIPTLVDNAEYWLQVYFKLKDYETDVEEGRLVRLPCKEGTTVWTIVRLVSYGEVGDRATFDYRIDQRAFQLSMINEFGKTVFLTREEAEKALEEMEGEVK